MRKWWAALAFTCAAAAYAQHTVILTWDDPMDPDVPEYVLSSGLVSGLYETAEIVYTYPHYVEAPSGISYWAVQGCGETTDGFQCSEYSNELVVLTGHTYPPVGCGVPAEESESE